jgi:hypothetical protein
MNKRWVKVLRTFVGCKAAVGDVIELGGSFASELVASNKAVFTTAPAIEAPVVAPQEPPPPPASAPARRGRHQSKES